MKDLDFEAPIKDLSKADYHELSAQFTKAIPLDEKTGQPADSPAARVFSMLHAITGMLFQPSHKSEPFGAMVVFADGRRSPIPEDFRGAPVETLALLAERATTPLLRARLADVCWLLDRKRGTLGSSAISSYVEIVQKIDAGDLELPFEEKSSALDHECRDYLWRALLIGRSIGWDKPEGPTARDWVIKLRKRAKDQRAAIPVGWFSKLDLDLGISDASEVAANIEEVLLALGSTLDLNTAADLWRVAARAYRVAEKKDDAHRCQAEAAECLVLQSETIFAKQGSAMLASHQLSDAIAQLHGIPGKRTRRTELRHRLIDIQAGISEEMSALSRFSCSPGHRSDTR